MVVRQLGERRGAVGLEVRRHARRLHLVHRVDAGGAQQLDERGRLLRAASRELGEAARRCEEGVEVELLTLQGALAIEDKLQFVLLALALRWTRSHFL